MLFVVLAVAVLCVRLGDEQCELVLGIVILCVCVWFCICGLAFHEFIVWRGVLNVCSGVVLPAGVVGVGSGVSPWLCVFL